MPTSSPRSAAIQLPNGMRQLSAVFAVLCLMVAAYAALSGLFLCGFTLFAPDTLLHQSGQAITAMQRLAIGPASALPGLITAWSLTRGRRCFKGLARNEVFTRRTVGAFRDFAVGMVAAKVVQFVAYGLAVVSGVGKISLTHRIEFRIKPGLSDESLTLILMIAVALIAVVLSRAADLAEEAQALASENEQFV